MPEIMKAQIPDAPDNSYASRSVAKKEVKQVVHGKAVDDSNTFFKGTVAGAGKSIMHDILIPAAKDTIYNMFNSFMSSILFGNTDIQQRGRSNGYMRTMDGRSYNNYQRISSDYGPDRFKTNMQRSVYEYQNVEFETRGDAELALSMLRDIIDEQGLCTVLNLYELAGIKPNSTDANYGWYELPEGIVKAQKKFNGYYRITLPPVVAIRR